MERDEGLLAVGWDQEEDCGTTIGRSSIDQAERKARASYGCDGLEWASSWATSRGGIEGAGQVKARAASGNIAQAHRLQVVRVCSPSRERISRDPGKWRDSCPQSRGSARFLSGLLTPADGCPPLSWHILEVIINALMVVEVGTRWVAYGKVRRSAVGVDEHR